jgi:hypothetical protein
MPAIMAYEEVEVWLHAFLTSAVDGDQWSASSPGRGNPPVPTGKEGKWARQLIWTEKNVCCCQSSNYDTSVVKSWPIHYSDSYIPITRKEEKTEEKKERRSEIDGKENHEDRK